MKILSELITSLSKSEKRYFKLFAIQKTIKEKNNYILLFDAIEKGIILPKSIKNLAATKTQLYNLILKSLRHFQEKSSVSNQIRLLIHEVEILFNKGLFDHCKKRLKKAKELGEDLELYSLLSQILYWEEKVNTQGGTPGIKHMTKNHAQYIDKNKFTDKLKLICYDIFKLIFQFDIARNLSEKKRYLEKLILLNKYYKPNTTYYGTYYHLTGKTMCHLALGNNKDGIKTADDLLILLNKNPKQIAEDYPHYFSAFQLCISMFEVAKAYIKIEQALVLFIRTKMPNEIYKRKILTYSLSTNISLSVKKLSLKDIPLFEIQANELLKLSNPTIYSTSIIPIFFELSYANIILGKYDQALIWTNKLLDISPKGYRTDLQAITWIFNLIIHLELKNHSLLTYMANSVKRFLKNNTRFYGIEQEILKLFITTLPKTITEKEKKEAYVLIEKKLQHILQSSIYEQRFIDYFDIVSWTKSKIQNKPFVEILKENSN